MIRQRAVTVKLEETDAAITNFPGVVPLLHLADRLGLLENLDRWMPPNERDRGYAPSAALFDLMCIPLAGGSCIDDLAQLRRDEGLTRLLGRQVIAPSTAHDVLRRYRYATEPLGQVRRDLLARVARRTGTRLATLDCDASLFASTGKNARMSYLGQTGYMPVFAFWMELGLVVHDDFRNGNAAPGGDALAFLQEALAQLPETVTEVRVRSDSAWYQAAVLDDLAERGHRFGIGADLDEAVLQAIQAIPERDWTLLLPEEPHRLEDPGYGKEWVAETVHTLNEARHAYRLVVLRREDQDADGECRGYTYHAHITNMALPVVEQLDWYQQRGEAENRIKELKWDLETRVLPSGDFFVNAVYLRVMTLAMNLVAALKLLALPAAYRPLRLKALRFRVLGIPAVVRLRSRQRRLQLPRGHPHLPAFHAALAA